MSNTAHSSLETNSLAFFIPLPTKKKIENAADWAILSFVFFSLPRREEESGALSEAEPRSRSWTAPLYPGLLLCACPRGGGPVLAWLIGGVSLQDQVNDLS